MNAPCSQPALLAGRDGASPSDTAHLFSSFPEKKGPSSLPGALAQARCRSPRWGNPPARPFGPEPPAEKPVPPLRSYKAPPTPPAAGGCRRASERAPPGRAMGAPRPCVCVWHGLSCAWFALVLHRACLLPPLPVDHRPADVAAYGGPWKFLTVLNLLLQAILYGVSLLVDVFTLMKKQGAAKFVLPFRDLLFGSVAFPISMFVSTAFWMLYLYDRQLIYPKILDGIIPVWLNHAMHTSIFPFALIELCFVPRRYPSKRKRLSLLVITCLGYIAWSVKIYSVIGRWAYPILDSLSPLGIAALFLGSFGMIAFYCQLGAFLCRMIWGDTVVIFDTSKKKSK
uniref:androgen-dependent TFPI-regulating protein n=1 Tax=Euleptes europaea TaxID=460621 RepID=UPI002540FCCF|nr:androgen-dependent TFPI-regulating protein [Euleptes europaea]